MSLRDHMQLTNITSDETSGVDIGAKWLAGDLCHVALRFNEDDKEDVEFHMALSPEDIATLRDFLNDTLGLRPGSLLN